MHLKLVYPLELYSVHADLCFVAAFGGSRDFAFVSSGFHSTCIYNVCMLVKSCS